MKKFITSLAVLAIFASAANADVWINEVLTNPNGSDSTTTTGNEHFELRGTPGMSLWGYYLLSVEGGGTTGRGDINQFFDLSAFSIGANGYLFARQNFSAYTATATGATVIQNTAGQGWGLTGASTVGHSGDGTQVDLENGTTTIMLIDKGLIGSAPELTMDLDENDDGWLDDLPFDWTIVDSVGIIDGAATQAATDWSYGAITLRVGGAAAGSSQYGNIVDVPGAPPTTAGAMWVGRNRDSTGSAPADWLGAILNGTAADPLNIIFASSNDPDMVGRKLPDMAFGGSNIPEPSDVVWTGAVDNKWDVNTTANFSGKPSGTFSDHDRVTFDDTGTNTTITIATGGVAPGSLAFSNTVAKDYVLSGGPIKGATSLVVSGGGQVTLQSANTYTGATSVEDGTLKLDGDGSIASSLITVASGASLDVSTVTGGYTLASDKTLQGTGAVTGDVTAGSGSILAPGEGTLTFSNGLTLATGAKVRVSNPGSNIIQISGDYTDALGSHLLLASGTMAEDQVSTFLQWTGAKPDGMNDGVQSNWTRRASGAKYWIGTASNNWTNGTSWDGFTAEVVADTTAKTLSIRCTSLGMLPDEASDVIIDPTTSNIVVSGPASPAPAVAINSLQVGGTNNTSPTLTLGTAAFNVTGAVTVAGNGTLNAVDGPLTAPTLNVSGATAAATLGHASGSITTANVTAGTLTVNAGTVSTLALPTGSTGQVVVGPSAKVTTADFSAGAGTVTANNPLAITSTLKLAGNTTATLTGGTSFAAQSVSGSNIVDNTAARTLTLQGGTLTLNRIVSVSVELTNPSFETDAGVANYWQYQDLTGWTNSGGHGIEQGSSREWAPAAPPNYDASTNYKWAFVQPSTVSGPGERTMSQIVDVAAAGNYTIRFAAVGRRGIYGPANVKVQIDGEDASPVFIPSTSAWASYTSNAVALTAGSHELKFFFMNPGGGDKSSCLDAVTMTGDVASYVNYPNTAIAATASSTLDLSASDQNHTLGGLNLTANGVGGTTLTVANANSLTVNGISATAGTGTAAAISGPTLKNIAGTVSVGNGATLTINSVLSDGNGSNTTQANALTKSGTGTLTLSDVNTYTGETRITAGTLSVTGSITSAVTVDPDGAISGTGTITSDVDVNGTFAVAYDGDADTIDLLTIAGELDLTDATINFSNVGSGTLARGTYMFASYSTLVGDPAEYVGLLPNWSVNYHYSGNNIALLSRILGDANDDGEVDDMDASILGANWLVPSGATWSDGDFNGDGKVNDRDAAILAAHWGATSGGDGAVPEPSMLMLLVGLAIGAWIVRRRRTR